jgi:hypothetical protein
MFFFKYNTLDEATVTAKFAAQPKAESESPLCGALVGKSLSLKLTGKEPLTLDYKFASKDALTVVENGTSYDAPYSALTLEGITLFTHLIPGTSRGYHVIYNKKTELVTVFESWCGIEVPVGGDLFGMKQPTGTRKIPREVQREIYEGYNDAGQPAPEKLHATTNRLEGKAFHWTDDRGVELLTFHPSLVCSTFVELSVPRGGITITAPSDYIRISDHLIIYSRGECEFSGTLVVELIDLFTVKSIGMRLGLDENDAVDYRMYKASGEITGQAAFFEPFSDHGDQPSDLNAGGKGARYSYRPADMHAPLTKAEVDAAVAKGGKTAFAGETIMTGSNNMAPTDFLVGKQFALKFDGEYHQPAPWAGTHSPVYEYDVVDSKTLKWRVPGGKWQEDRYQAFEPAKDIILFAHLLTGDPDHRCLTNAVDFSNGLVTCVDAQIGNWRTEWEVGNRAIFGTLDYPGVTPPLVRRHGFTTDLVGKSFTWAYSDTMGSIHVYSSPESYSWTIFQGNNAGGATWSSPCFYVKLRDDAYLFCWVEENCNGSQGTMVFNPRIMHDAGYFYGASENGVQLSVMGAYARTAGSFDILKYFENRQK